MRFVFAILALAAAGAAGAADEPDAVLAKWHRAGLQADVHTMLRLSTEAQRARMKIDVDWEERAQKLPFLLPASYAITGRAAGASRVVLSMAGTGGYISGKGKSSGKATLIVEAGEWRVERIEWLPYIEPLPFENTARPVNPSVGAPAVALPPSQPRAVAVPAPAAAPAPAPAR